MGVYFDFFRAENDEAAVRTRTFETGPLGPGPGQDAGIDGCETKSVFPDPHLEILVALAAGVPYERGPWTSERLWPPADTPPPVDEDSIWFTDPSIERLATRLRDGLAAIDEARAGELAAAWLPELGIGFTHEQVTVLVAELGRFARRARQAGQEIYCWSVL